jgi:hypothetical protein
MGRADAFQTQHIAAVAITQFLSQFHRESQAGDKDRLERQISGLWERLCRKESVLPYSVQQIVDLYGRDLEKESNHVIVVCLVDATRSVSPHLAIKIQAFGLGVIIHRCPGAVFTAVHWWLSSTGGMRTGGICS